MKVLSSIRNFVMNPSKKVWHDVVLWILVVVGIYIATLVWLHG
jgi:hypothetical protein